MGVMLVSCFQTTSPRALRAALWADLYDCVYCVHVPLHPLPRHLHASRARLRGDSLMATAHRQRARVCVSVAGHATPYRRDDAGNGDLLPPAPPRRHNSSDWTCKPGRACFSVPVSTVRGAQTPRHEKFLWRRSRGVVPSASRKQQQHISAID